MGNTSSGVATPTKKRALPLVIVLVMAVLAALVMLYATVANGYEDSSYSPMQKPVIVEKQLEPGVEADDTDFQFELIVSPTYINDRYNQIDKGSSAVTSVDGIVFNADGTPAYGLDEDGLPVKTSYPIKDHTISFTLKAGQKVLFKELPFAHKDADCGFIVNEIIPDDSAYGFSKVLVTEGAQYVPEDKATYDVYKSLLTTTGTSAKAIYDSYEEAVYAYYDENGNEVTNPNCSSNDYVSVYLSTGTDPVPNWHFNVYDYFAGDYVYYDADGNVVDEPNNLDEDYGGERYVKDGKIVTPNWVDCAYKETINHATEVRFLNKIAPVFKPLTVAKALEGDDAVADNTDFEFELIISPAQIGTKDAVSDQTVEAIIYDVDGTQTPVTCTMENQKITFKLKADQRIEFPKMPFSRADGDTGKFIVNELVNDALTEYGYSYSKTELSDGAAWSNAAVAGLVGKGTTGQTIPDGMTVATVYNKQTEPTPDEPTPPAGSEDYAAITVSKALEGAVQADGTIFNFELITSPSFKGTPNTIAEGTEVEGTTYGANGSVQTTTYKFADNTIKFSLKAGESISFPKLPYIDLDKPTGKFIVNELGATDAKGNAVEGYEFKYVEVAKDTQLDAAEDKVADILKPTGVYGQLTTDADTRVKFVNAKIPEEPEYPVIPEDITKSFSVTKSLVQGTTYGNERFPFEAIISPETIGAEGDLISGSVITGTVTNYDGKVVSTTEYIVGKDHAVYFNLKADQTMTFTGIPSSSMDVDELIVVNELALDEDTSKRFYLAVVTSANIYNATAAQEQQFDGFIQKGTTGKNAGALLKFENGTAAVTFFNANPQPPKDGDPKDEDPKEPEDPGTPGNPDQPLTPQGPTDPTPSNPTNPGPTPGSYLPRTPTNMTPVGEEILDDGVPLASFVQTGDENTMTFIVLFALEGLSIIALIVLMILKRHDRKLALARARHGA